MPYDELLVQPMREELTRIGFQELRTPEEVDQVLPLPGTTFVVVNSVCGCTAAAARPGVALALQKATVLPDRLVTVFAGQDLEATARAREYFTNQPPSSPSFALLKDGKLVFMMHRHHIEMLDPEGIADTLVEAFERFCRKEEPSNA